MKIEGLTTTQKEEKELVYGVWLFGITIFRGAGEKLTWKRTNPKVMKK